MDPEKKTSRPLDSSSGAGEHEVSRDWCAGLTAAARATQQNSNSSSSACDSGGDASTGDGSAASCRPQAPKRSSERRTSPEIIMQSTEGSLLHTRLAKKSEKSDSMDDSGINHPLPRHVRSGGAAVAEQPFRLSQRGNEMEDQRPAMSPGSFERDAAAQFKMVAERFRALMERRERRLEEALSDPETRADLEAMFPMMKYGDYQTMLAGVRGMEEGDFQTLLDGARKRRREVRRDDSLSLVCVMCCLFFMIACVWVRGLSVLCFAKIVPRFSVHLKNRSPAQVSSVSLALC